ncbi:glycosyl hydrolase [Sphingomonas mollis]|uniref:Glycoside hydrolase n=1 Tax=Sphingomonas mollis TaxID=2795726 RepID=A0ABS0XNK7_9SPHN|nr:glycosyl hydrolase [Sphingomonas sp. BT553]MBJ6121631.1 glycoside hydrolase [Sphingomonas sp. BT553]
MRPTRLIATVAALLASTSGWAQQGDPLMNGFREPPQSARPRTWWHWLNGNITEDGIVKDLEWMKRAGLGGVQNFDASLMTPQIVDRRLAYMTPEWKHAFRLAASTADRLGLELAIAGSPGWSETGGPWVPPADGMKKLVWSETDIVGGRRYAGRLVAPPGVTGPFQSLPFDDPLSAFEGKSAPPSPRFYADVAVLAYPVSTAVTDVAPVVTVGDAPVDATALADDRADTKVAVAKAGGTLVFTYPRATTIRSATLFIPGALPPFGDPEMLPVLEVERNGAWQAVGTFPVGTVPTTIAFAKVTARRFRVVLGPNTAPKRIGLGAPAPGAQMEGVFPSGPPSTTIGIAHLSLSGEAKVDRFEAKAGFATVGDYYALSKDVPDLTGVDPAKVVDLTARMQPDGSLDWTPPAGRWRIVRIGTSLLGTTNHPATREATGLEVDKYDAAAVRRYLDHYLGMYRDATGADLIGAKGLRAIVTDSFEAGDANWTPRMVEQFRRLRGYDPTPWMPALTGAVIGSRSRSDAFLYDYRRTLADLMASEHYGTVATVAHANGLKVYGEALEDGRPALGNDIALRRHADVPMAAMWTFPREGQPRPTLIGDLRGAASVAHLYGQNVVAAESFTSAFSPWAFAPADLKHVVDLEFVNGVNRPVIHTSVHQPVDDKVPGLSLAIFGQYFNRHESWAEMARPWIDYIARSSFLLQQGRNVADVAYFFGEEAPLTALYAQAPLTDVPVTHAYDFVDADALTGQLSVTDGALVSPSGARYRVLYLGGSSARMTLATLRRIAALVEQGATVVGDAPTGSPALGDDAAAYRTLVGRLWGGGAMGKGRVVAGRDIEAALAGVGIAPDFTYAKAQPDSDVAFVHRAMTDGDVYFVSNRRDRAERTEARFRVSGKVPELWHADTGRTTAVSYRIEEGRTVVPLDLAAGEAVFVVFRKPATANAATVAAPAASTVARIDGPWTVTFQPGRGAPAALRLPTLAPLDSQTDPKVRYFSGVATYTADVTLPVVKGRLMLDLGRIGDVAEVRVNGQSVGTAWHVPYRLDLGTAARRGRNRIEVRVANLWVNRLIGDAQPGAVKTTFTSLPTYRAAAPLRPSGLIGPVTISAAP